MELKSTDSPSPLTLAASVKLGTTGLCVSPMGFGCMGMTAFYGQHMKDEDAIDLLRGVHKLGYTHFDTAEAYRSRRGEQHNEEIVGRFLHELPHGSVTVATKYMPTLHDGRCDLETVEAAVDASRSRLGVESIDLYYCHRMPKTEALLHEWMLSIREVVAKGKVKHVGLSEVSPKWLRHAHAVHPVACIQQEWSLLSRGIEQDLVHTCKELGVGIVAYAPLARSLLCDPDRPPQDWRLGSMPRFAEENFSRNKELVSRVSDLASTRGLTAAQLSLVWLYNRAEIMRAEMVAIPGTRQLEHAEANAASLGVQLTEAEHVMLQELAQLVAGERAKEAYLKEGMEGQMDLV